MSLQIGQITLTLLRDKYKVVHSDRHYRVTGTIITLTRV